VIYPLIIGFTGSTFDLFVLRNTECFFNYCLGIDSSNENHYIYNN